MVNEEFFDLVLYSIFKAVNEYIGKDTWKIVYRVGEIIVDELWDELGLTSELSALDGLNKLSRWLVSMGYVKDLKFIEKEDGSLEYWMLEPIISNGAKRLLDENLVPPHISTSILFAFLNRLGYRVEMRGDPIFRSDGYIIEKWVLKEASE